jgi:amino acid adenylation domain-containing protein
MMSPAATLTALTLEQKRALVARLLREKAGPEPPVSNLVHRWIEEQAARSPEGIALVSEGESITYAQLNARANRLARKLRGLGVGPEILVGLCTGRNAAIGVGLLAILKAGGAYVPLDATFPAERLRFMLEDARLSVLLTEERLRNRLEKVAARVICLDSQSEESAAASAVNLDGGAGGDNLAYVIYTSGSTGRPKGVQVTHGALANLLKAMGGLLAMREHDVLLAVTTLSFDIAALEIFLPWIVGARLELIDRDVAADGVRLADRLNDPAITFLQATPATWRLLLEAGWRGKPALQMLCGGEALPRALADRLQDKGAALWNLYGPTETTIWSSACRVEPGETPISIGRPIANTQLYVLDKRLRVVPMGVIGELYIGGAGLARGYWARPGLTADRFIPDPCGTTPGARLYRSGDLARWRPDGGLECLGRVDHQVKIRGFRVELEEIEATFALHPEVRDAAVAARPDPTGEMSLAAYIVMRDGPNLTSAAELRRWLADFVPEYMIPSAFVSLDALPLTPNGKVDRHALPDSTRARPTEAANFVPSRGPVEAALAELWRELLASARFGAHDSFFECGGHSLLALQLLGRVRQIFEVEVPLERFLDEPTIARLACLVERALAEGSTPADRPLVRVPRDEPLPTSFAQQRIWFLDQLEPGCISYHIPSVVRLEGQLDIPALERALNEVVRRHEILRTTLVPVGGIPRQVIAEQLELPLAVEDLSVLPENEREPRALLRLREHVEQPFDLARGPLVRAGLLRLSEREYIAIVTMHHAISDGWSIGILVRELSRLYESFHLGEPSPFPELAIQYADYAASQRTQLRDEGLQAQLDYWTSQLAGVPHLDLPTDRPRPPLASQRGGQRISTLPKATIDAASALGRRQGATLYMTLLAAFQVLLHRYSGQEDIAIGSPIAGRTRPELDGLIGFFVNTLVLRGDLSGNPSFLELLLRVRRKAIEAFGRQDVPFERLVNIVSPQRDGSRPPLFQVMFALQNMPMPVLRAPQLLVTPLELPTTTSKFDLTLFAMEVADGLRLTMEYSTDLFDAATVDRMLAHYQILLEEMVAQPGLPIGAIPILTPEERSQVLVKWNTPALDDIAAEFHGLTYDDLDSDTAELFSAEAATDD